jgi:hypothetical protein
MKIMLFLLFILLGVLILNPVSETFELQRKPAKGGDIQVGTLPNTPGPIANLMVELNKVGGQMQADSEYDVVPMDKLDKNKV